MNRIERISAILIQLQAHSQVKASQIAQRFGISLRTVYRDIRTLEEAGIPIIGNPGMGYSLEAGFKLPPLMFTSEEALSFLIAEKFVYELSDADSADHFRSGIEKIRAVMRLADKHLLDTVEECLAVLKTSKPSVYKPDILQTILRGIYHKKNLNITYAPQLSSNVSEREVEPVGIFFSKTNWYLTAYCLQKKKYLTFRIDRVQKIILLDKAQKCKHPHLKTFLDDIYDKEHLHEVVIHIKKNKSTMMSDDKYYYGLISEREIADAVEYHFFTFSLEKFAHWYLSFADEACIIKPTDLKEIVRKIIQRISL